MQSAVVLEWTKDAEGGAWAAHDRALNVWCVIRLFEGVYGIEYQDGDTIVVGTDHATLEAAQQAVEARLAGWSGEELIAHGDVDRDGESVAGDEGGE